MITYQSNELIAKLEQQTTELYNDAGNCWLLISHTKFSSKPAPEKWSANECLQHLNTYGNYYLPEIEKGINTYIQNKGRRKKEFTPGILGNYFTKMMLPEADGTIKKKMKAPKKSVPQNIEESAQVVNEFIRQQKQLLQLLSLARQVDLEKIKIPISIAPFIKLKLGDVFMFVIAHNQRHALQAHNVLKELTHKRVLQPLS